MGDGVGGKRIVQAQGSADGEAAVGDVVGVAGGPLFLTVVYQERANFERGRFVGFAVGGSVGLSVGDAACDAECHGVDLGGRGEEGRRKKRSEAEHDVRSSRTKRRHELQVSGR